jgi:hypothetical protein
MMKLSAAVRRGLPKSTLALAIALAAVFGAPKAEAQTTTTCAPLTQGFWKNHPTAWGKVTTLTLGTVTYTKTQLETILETPVRGDASLILAHQLIAALLNIEVTGTSATTPTTLVADTIKDAKRCWTGGRFPKTSIRHRPLGKRLLPTPASSTTSTMA